MPVTRVSAPPDKPVLVFDGDCSFCRRWIARWRQTTGDLIEYLPFQDPACAHRFPELPAADLSRGVHLVDRDGTVTRHAEAVFRSLAIAGAARPASLRAGPHASSVNDGGQGAWRARGWLRAYRSIPGFAPLTEWGYRFIADHRDLADRATTLLWGRRVERSSHFLSRWLFLRLLALAYLAAFASLGTQIVGLVGSGGVLPAAEFLDAVGRFAAQQEIGLDRYRLVPTLAWIDASDTALRVLCIAGSVLSGALLAGLAPVPALVALWALFLSLVTIGRDFLAFQWDGLLLEVGLLAIFLAPWTWWDRPGGARRSTPGARWLLLWLLFRFMLGSGVIKLTSGDPTWRSLTALTYHYWTQPLPTPLGWYADRLPAWFHQLSCAVVFAIELAAPFFIPMPRRLRLVACWLMAGLQVGIAITGNYAYFNLLTIALCILLLDDRALNRWMPAAWRSDHAWSHRSEVPRARQWVGATLIFITLPISVLMLANSFQVSLPVPAPVGWMSEAVAPFRSINPYGLFATMTTTRPEIIVEGSDDGSRWRPYEFAYKPGDPARRPAFVAPHQPRLDWQMWFAALGECDQNPWLSSFGVRLLEGSRNAVNLLASDPFDGRPPRYVRMMRYEYRFADRAEQRATGDWWTRELVGEYCPAISLADVGRR